MVYRAPGRVNLIGEHTDYNGGFVLPAALNLVCSIDTTPRSDGLLAVEAVNLGQTRTWPAAELKSLTPSSDWTDYIIGVARELIGLGFDIRPATLRISSTIPIGAGLSSSAALEVASALALLDGRALDPFELARLCHRAETGFAGLPCGMMDQIISVFGRPDGALWIDCRELVFEPVTLPGVVVLVAVDSMVKHELAASAYRDRVAECAAAARSLGLAGLRDAGIEDSGKLDGVQRRRARHVTTENQRVVEFVEACRSNDPSTMGRLMTASHASLRDDYEVSCSELDFLVETALSIPGVLGARMTGGGFGGCIVGLMMPEAEDAFRAGVTHRFQARFGLIPSIFSVRASAGATLLNPLDSSTLDRANRPTGSRQPQGPE